MPRKVRTAIVSVAVAVLGGVVWPAPAAASSTIFHETFDTPSKTFTILDGPPVGPYAGKIMTLTADQSKGRYERQNLEVTHGRLHMTIEGDAGAYAVLGPTSGYAYGDLSVRMKVTGSGAGAGFALLLWPADDVWSEGEVNIAEASQLRPGNTLHAYVHSVGHCRPDWCPNAWQVDTHKTLRGWHTYRARWEKPSGKCPGGRLRLYRDGKKYADVDHDVPNTPERLVLQTGGDHAELTHVWVSSVTVTR